jgi:hypothetical protein
MPQHAAPPDTTADGGVATPRKGVVNDQEDPGD